MNVYSDTIKTVDQIVDIFDKGDAIVIVGLNTIITKFSKLCYILANWNDKYGSMNINNHDDDVAKHIHSELNRLGSLPIV